LFCRAYQILGNRIIGPDGMQQFLAPEILDGQVTGSRPNTADQVEQQEALWPPNIFQDPSKHPQAKHVKYNMKDHLWRMRKKMGRDLVRVKLLKWFIDLISYQYLVQFSRHNGVKRDPFRNSILTQCYLGDENQHIDYDQILDNRRKIIRPGKFEIAHPEFLFSF